MAPAGNQLLLRKANLEKAGTKVGPEARTQDPQRLQGTRSVQQCASLPAYRRLALTSDPTDFY